MAVMYLYTFYFKGTGMFSYQEEFDHKLSDSEEEAYCQERIEELCRKGFCILEYSGSYLGRRRVLASDKTVESHIPAKGKKTILIKELSKYLKSKVGETPNWVISFTYENIDGIAKKYEGTFNILEKDYWSDCVFCPPNDSLIFNVKLKNFTNGYDFELSNEDIAYKHFTFEELMRKMEYYLC